MPNGIDRNWVRMCAAINGFRARYGSWPAIIHLPEDAIEFLFTKETFAILESKISFVYDGSPFIAEGGMGRSYNYGREGFSSESPDITAREWLNVEPDSEVVKEYYAPRRSNAEAGVKVKHRRNGCLTVLVSELVLLIIVIIIFLVAAAVDYDGTCISWEPPIPSCSMGEYMRQVALLMPFGLVVLSIQYWWIAVSLIVLAPILGNSILFLKESL